MNKETIFPERKPKWIRTKRDNSAAFHRMSGILTGYNLNTVCRSARCPNICDCFSRNHVTFMILGDICTRTCKFCSVKKERPISLDPDESGRIIKAVGALGLSYVIITSVTRDDLSDGGVGVFADLVNRLKQKYQHVKIEILTPDFLGIADEGILDSAPYVWAHNVETVPELYKDIRPQADYNRSLGLLKSIKIKKSEILTKSGIMLGLGEKKEDVLMVLEDLKSAGVDMVTIGQYLRPSKESVPVKRFLTLDEFRHFREYAQNMGFKHVSSGPLVRSSYMAEGTYATCE